MLTAFLYHRVGAGKYANPPEMIREHLHLIHSRHDAILPGDPIPLFRRAICLTFDDATYDFYHYVFPILQELRLKALLAIPTRFILETTALPSSSRLSVPYSRAMSGEHYQTEAPFCTWEELRIMAKSGLVACASHSVHHRNLLLPDTDLDLEISGSKRILEERLNVPIRTFVYPMGKFNNRVHALVKQHYPFAMRIGSACNFSWQNRNGLVYRMICDNLQTAGSPLGFKATCSSLWFYLLNSLRGR